MREQTEAPLRILAIAPYEAMRIALLRAAEAYPGIEIDAFTGDLQEGVAIMRQTSLEHYDAVISRGGTAELIRPETDLPVIEIPVSVYDVLRTIKLSENYTGQCAVVGFPGVTENAHILCNLLRKDNIPIQTVNDAQSAESVLESLCGQGIHTVICDMVTHRIARSKGMNALLITSGESSIRQAIQEAAEQGAAFRRLRDENQFLRGVLWADSRQSVVFNEDKDIVFAFSSDVSPEMIALMRRKISGVKSGEELLFYHQAGSVLHAVSAVAFQALGARYYLFRDQPGQIALRSSRSGIQAFDAEACENLFMNSFFSISGSLGELEERLTPIASASRPVLIIGEKGTGKEQIGQALYLRSRLKTHPIVVLDGARLNDRSWDYLLENRSSPLAAPNTTLFFRHLESAPAEKCRQLLALIEEAGLSRSLWLIFSCDAEEDMPLSPVYEEISAKFGPMTLHMPTLRSRRDEIPSLASLYLGNLNMELGKQVSGFDPGALEMLIQFDWPLNYTQFKHVLQELTLHTDGPYISNADVAELLSQERKKYRRIQRSAEGFSFAGQTLDEITAQIVRQALAQNGGNQSLTARQLGISRTTLWRMLSTIQ